MTDDGPGAPRVFVIGSGRAGRSFAAALAAAGTPVLGVHGRERPFPPALGAADVVVVATPDAAIDAVLRAVADETLAPGAVVLQMSGARAPGAPDDLVRARRAGVGTFHPLVPLADPALGAERFRGAWVGVGGDADAVAAAESLARRVGARPLPIPDAPEARAAYHAAAVFASNFPIVLAAVAERLFEASGVDAAGARGAVRHLMASAVANLAASRDAGAALTGPVARGDAATVARHLAALEHDGDASALYRALTRASVDLARDGRRAAAADLDAIAALLG
ncbi:oxidoreductase [Gemmatimonadetes bacterium T265]|nr:oxidoreductase [Gemmatimonadetes bacterium T265]